MRIELNADQLLKISNALTNESIRLLGLFNETPLIPKEQDEAWGKYLEISGLERKVSEAYRKAAKKECLARIRPKAA